MELLKSYTDIFRVVNIVIAVNFVGLGGLLLSKERFRLSSKAVFGCVVLFIGLRNLGTVLESLPLRITYPVLIDLNLPFVLLIPPLLFLYTQWELSGERPSFKKVIPHLIIPMAMLMIFIPALVSPSEKVAWLASGAGHWFNRLRLYTATFASVFSLVYAVVALFKIRTKIIAIRNTERNSLRLFVTALTFLFALSFINMILHFWRIRYFTEYFMVLNLGLYFMILYQLIRQEINPKPSSRKYQKSTLSDLEKSDLLNRIVLKLEKERYYSNRLASLHDLARRISSSPNYVSQVINEKMNRTFLEVLAEYRIREAQQLILSGDSLSMEQVAEKVGYNSKSAFYQAFKRITGKTPLDFRLTEKVVS
ncbi:MAG: helix-turn-helix domain-containing protein [Bacteroidota bacterium]